MIFSTCGIPAAFITRELLEKNHAPLREKLLSKGFTVIGAFGCAGFNTHSCLQLFGGLNTNRPNADDLGHAEAFVKNVVVRTNRKR